MHNKKYKIINRKYNALATITGSNYATPGLISSYLKDEGTGYYRFFIVSFDCSHVYMITECVFETREARSKRPCSKLNQLKGTLSDVDISSQVPDNLGNLTSLTSLTLGNYGLYGEFPTAIFQLPNLEILAARDNENLTGSLPEFHKNSRLKILQLDNTSFSGLTKLTELHLGLANLFNEIPSSFANLTQLAQIDLRHNQLAGEIPSWTANMTQEISIDLSTNKFEGQIPSSFSQLKNLDFLSVINNKLSGTILDLGDNQIEDIFPFWLGALPRLRILVLRSNRFNGAIKGPIMNEDFPKLWILDLSNNGFTGNLPLG
ncbi:hypothetical protein LguiB_005815 [Lonicera macranthoides]